MQFRRQGKKIQLISYRGYVNKKDAEAKGIAPGAQVKFIGTIDPDTFELSVATDKDTGQPFQLTDKERGEVDAYIADQKAARLAESQGQTLRTAVTFMGMAADALKAGGSFEIQPHHKPEQLWAALVALEKTLIAAGHQRPKRQYKRKPTPDTATQQLPFTPSPGGESNPAGVAQTSAAKAGRGREKRA